MVHYLEAYQSEIFKRYGKSEQDTEQQSQALEASVIEYLRRSMIDYRHDRIHNNFPKFYKQIVELHKEYFALHVDKATKLIRRYEAWMQVACVFCKENSVSSRFHCSDSGLFWRANEII